MNPYINRLLANIPGGLPIIQGTTPALQINGTGTLSLTGNTLYITNGSQSASYDLYSLTIAQLAEQISSFTPVQALTSSIVELLELSNGQTSASLPCTLYIPTDDAYVILGMMARMLETRKRNRRAEVAQMNLQAAATNILDWWGASTGIPRYQGEPDVLYAQRITGMRFRPTQNNYSIQRLLKTLGYSATVTDTTPGQFTVRIQLPNSPPQGWTYSLAQIADIVNRVKSATYQATISVNAPLSDTVEISDSVASSTNPQAWTWGNFTWGQFTWNDEQTYYFINPGMIIQD